MHSLLCLILYAAWLSLLCNLDFSCFKSLYYVPFALVVLVCCSLPPLERERLKYMSKTSYRQIVSRLPFAYTYTHPINTTNRGGRYTNIIVQSNTRKHIPEAELGNQMAKD